MLFSTRNICPLFTDLLLKTKLVFYVNNFAVRGNSGIALDKITDPIWQSFDTLYHHQLIFLQFGPNIISSKTTQFGWYERAMSKVISRVNRNLPNTAFILLGVNDIAY